MVIERADVGDDGVQLHQRGFDYVKTVALQAQAAFGFEHAQPVGIGFHGSVLQHGMRNQHGVVMGVGEVGQIVNRVRAALRHAHIGGVFLQGWGKMVEIAVVVVLGNQ